MTSSTPHVIVTNVSKIYHGGTAAETTDVAAVNGISLTVPHGQFLAVMGPSGSGKTTLLHIIAGLTSVTAGTVSIADTDITKLSDRQLTLFRRRAIGVVFQSFNLIPSLTAEENILLPILAGHTVNKGDFTRALNELLERLDLTARRHHFPETLSGGEQQRVAIARALLPDYAANSQGSLLLADEPTGNLDSVNSDIICRLLRDLCNERHHTMVVITHEPAVARWADRIVTLKDGQIDSDKMATAQEG